MDEKYDISVNTETKFLFSTSGSQSSIAKHNRALNELGVNLVYYTFGHDISPEIYAGMLKSPIVLGAAVTGKGGLKSTIIPFLDHVEPLAQKTLAVNTVVNINGELHGYNTDAFGLRNALDQGIRESKLNVKTAVIYGNGGVSGVAFKVLQDMGIKVTMVGRDPKRVMGKRKELGIENVPHFEGPYDLVVDATPISSQQDFLESVGFAEIIDGSKIVFCHNMPEKDGQKNYLQEYCESHGIFFIPGKVMYASQLIKQYSLYFEEFAKLSGSKISEKDIVKSWNL